MSLRCCTKSMVVPPARFVKGKLRLTGTTWFSTVTPISGHPEAVDGATWYLACSLQDLYWSETEERAAYIPNQASHRIITGRGPLRKPSRFSHENRVMCFLEADEREAHG